MILRALIKRHNVAPQAGFIERLFLNLRLDRATRRKGVRRSRSRFHGGIHPGGDVLDRHQNVQLEIQAAFLFRRGGRKKTFAQIIMFLVAQLLGDRPRRRGDS